jgi:hypothetical protein
MFIYQMPKNIVENLKDTKENLVSYPHIIMGVNKFSFAKVMNHQIFFGDYDIMIRK